MRTNSISTSFLQIHVCRFSSASLSPLVFASETVHRPGCSKNHGSSTELRLRDLCCGGKVTNRRTLSGTNRVGYGTHYFTEKTPMSCMETVLFAFCYGSNLTWGTTWNTCSTKSLVAPYIWSSTHPLKTPLTVLLTPARAEEEQVDFTLLHVWPCFSKSR